MSRKAGVPNKNKQFLLNRLKALHGEDFDPMMRMVDQAIKLHGLANESGEPMALKASVVAWDKVAAYTQPKLKAVILQDEEDWLSLLGL